MGIHLKILLGLLILVLGVEAENATCTCEQKLHADSIKKVHVLINYFNEFLQNRRLYYPVPWDAYTPDFKFHFFDGNNKPSWNNKEQLLIFMKKLRPDEVIYVVHDYFLEQTEKDTLEMYAKIHYFGTTITRVYPALMKYSISGKKFKEVWVENR